MTHMKILSSRIPFVLLAGDVVAFIIGLYLTLLFRYGLGLSFSIVASHALPFALLFVVWILVFFIFGLYEKRSIVLRNTLLTTLFRAQIVNALLAITFFYFIPFFSITPKTNLFLYVLLSSSVIMWWRFNGYYLTGVKKREDAIIIGGGEEVMELKREVNANEHYALRFISSIDVDALSSIDFQKEVVEKVYSEEISVIVVDLHNPKVEAILPTLYNLIFSRVRFIDMHKVYEDVFNRVPLSLIRESWFLENISTAPKVVYDTLKRLMDITLASILAIPSLILFPFVALAIKLDDGWKIFICQNRIGKNGGKISIYKFRTMNVDDSGKWLSGGDARITRVGAFLRKSRIDELPQLWNVIKGDISLIGPRPDIYDLGVKLGKDIPYYAIRNVITPGLSGWAQIEQIKPPQSFEETKLRLAYDFFYIKNRSFLLDLKIALRTVKTLLSRVGL